LQKTPDFRGVTDHLVRGLGEVGKFADDGLNLKRYAFHRLNRLSNDRRHSEDLIPLVNCQELP